MKPLPKQLGQKYKSLFPKVSKALLALDPEPAAPPADGWTASGGEVDGESYEMQPDEVEVRSRGAPRPGGGIRGTPTWRR